MKIIVDAMGGDHAPLQIVLGAVDAIKQDKSLQVVLVGDESAINQCLCDCKDYDKNRLSIIDAKDVITNDDTPTTAIRTKKESSLVKAFDALNHDEDAGGFVSAGSTGAVLVGAYLKVGRIKGVTRPALAPVLPTLKGAMRLRCERGLQEYKSRSFCHYGKRIRNRYVGCKECSCRATQQRRRGTQGQRTHKRSVHLAFKNRRYQSCRQL